MLLAQCQDQPLMSNRMKIGARLLCGFGLLMLAIAGLSGFAIYASSDARQVLADVVRQKNHEVFSLEVQNRVLEARLAAWIGLATGDPAAFAQSDAAFGIATERLAALAAETVNPGRQAAITALKARFAEHVRTAAALNAVGGHNPALDTASNKPIIAAEVAAAATVAATDKPLAASYRDAAARLTADGALALHRLATIALIGGLVSTLSGCLISFIVARGITRPIRSLTGVMSALAKGDLSADIPALASHDEVGDMARAVAVFQTSMIEVARLRVEKETASQRAAEDRRQAMRALAARFEAHTGSIVASVSSQATQLQATAQSMVVIAGRTSNQAAAVAAASEQATQNVNTVAASAEELSASVREIQQRIAGSSRLILEAVADTDAAGRDVQGLAAVMDGIGAVVELIRGIAGQTNLLALNATIEAARAGEAGKGFAVVAGEVKALAGQTAQATEDIAGRIAAIQEATRRSVQAIQSIAAKIGQVTEASTTIAAAVEEQGTATAQIARSVTEAAQGNREVSNTINDVSSAAQQSGAAATQVSSSAASLGQSSEALKTQVDTFLAEVRAA